MIDNIVRVIAYFDEEGTMPADYVRKWETDYEAFVVKYDNENKTVNSVSIGRFPTVEAAADAIQKWNWLRLKTIRPN